MIADMLPSGQQNKWINGSGNIVKKKEADFLHLYQIAGKNE